MTPEALMRRLAKAVERSDFQTLLAAVDDEVIWHTGARQPGVLGLAGTYTSRAGLLEVTSKLATLLSFYRFEPKDIVANGEVVWGWFDAAASLIGPGARLVQFELVLRWRVREGKILEHKAFYDTAHVAAQIAAG